MDIAALKSKFSKLYSNARCPTEVTTLNNQLPEEYSMFLKCVGGGTVGDCRFEIYDTPLSSNHIYGGTTSELLNDILFFGDDYNGFCVGLDPNKNWAVVEVDKFTMETEVLAETLNEFLMQDIRLGSTDQTTN